MYCPHCGVSNDRGEAACFICHKPLPQLDAPASPARARAERREAAAAAAPTMGSVGDRAIALFFDRIVLGAILLAAGSWAADHWSGYRLTSPMWGAIGTLGGLFLATFLYHFISEVMFLTTIGKAAMGLHVAVEEGRGRLAAIAIRNLLRLIDAIGFYLIGFLFATFTTNRQRLGDLLGKTFVVEWPVPRGGRAAVMFLIIVIVVAAVWIAGAMCPTCSNQLRSISGR